jgi:hypothetical protein
MTAGGARVDLDRLADFVGGALDGTPDADAVRHLITTDSGWAEAYTALVSADELVRGQLNALGSEAPAVPSDVGARLDAALAGAAPPRLQVVPQERDELAERRARRRRWSVGLATAAAVLVCASLGVAVLRNAPYSSNSSTSSADQAGGAAAPPKAAAPAPSGGPAIYSTGRDYTADSLRSLSLLGGLNAAGKSPNAMQEDSGAQSGAGSGAGPLRAEEPTAVPGPLARLASPAARTACLDAIVAAYGGRVVVADYASFQGQPALVVLLDGAAFAGGGRGAVVVGSQCGIGNAPDVRYKQPL